VKENTMPKQTPTKTPEQLQAEADELARQASEVQAELDRLSLEEYEREQAAQAERDRATVENYDRAALDQGIADAKENLYRELGKLPFTRALAGYIAAGYRLSWAHRDYASAVSRLDLGDPGSPPSGVVDSAIDWSREVREAAIRLAQEQIDQERGQA
jgi:hypothetical protein